MKRTKAGGSRITTANDSRIFWWGKVLRTLKIDELPQLFNILQGDMAVIGPRPEDVSIVNESYDEVMMESLLVLPGLASPGSLYNYTHLESLIDADGGEDIYLEKILPLKVRLDVVYARNKSFLYDVRIIFKTIAIIFLRALNYASFKDPIELKEAKSI